MALRTFTDGDGKAWNAWLVIPNGAMGSYPEAFRNGWLCFELVGGGGRCRVPLPDVPDGWEKLPDARLDLMRRAASSSATGSMVKVPDSGETSIREA